MEIEGTLPGKLMVDQDPCSGSVAGDSGHGSMVTTSGTKPVDTNKELIGAVGGTDENVSTGYCSNIEWKEEDLLIKLNDGNVTIPQMPAASTPVQALAESRMFSPPELPMGKKRCFRVSTAAWPPLTNIIPWIKDEAQNMMEPNWRQELQCIRENDHIRYIIAMLVWFNRWRQEHGLWPSLPASDFQVGAMAMPTIITRVMSVTTEIEMTLGEMQALWVLTTLQYLVEVGPKSPSARQIAQSVQLIMQSLQQAEISFMPHAVFRHAILTQSRGTSVKTDVSCADISSTTLQCVFS